MRYITFGRRSGLRVSQYALGTGTFGSPREFGTEPDEARAIFDRFVDAGGNFIDTADVYQGGRSEELVGSFARSRRDELVLGTKFSAGGNRHLARTGNARKALRISVEQSLRRLDTDYVDVLWVHFPDALTPMDEILRGLDDLVGSGKILYAAFSNFPAWRVSRGALLADLSRWAPITAIQVEYSLVERTPDRELLPMAEALGLAVGMWSPLGGGLLTAKYRRSSEGRLQDWKRLVHTESTPQKAAIVDEVIAIAHDVDRSPAQVATAWVSERARRLATPGIPIVGPRRLEQLDDYLAALDLELTDDQFLRLATVSAIDLGVPHAGNAAAIDGLQGGLSQSFEPLVVPVE